jgi:hypothetical protein
VTTETLLPQLLWPEFHRYRWLVVPEDDDLRAVVGRAFGAGVRSLVLLTARPTAALAEIDQWYRAAPGPPSSPVPVVVLNSR